MFLSVQRSNKPCKTLHFQASSHSERSLFYPNVRYSFVLELQRCTTFVSFWNVATAAGPFGAFHSFVLEVCPLVTSVLRSTLVSSRRVSRHLASEEKRRFSRRFYSGVLLKNEYNARMSVKPISEKPKMDSPQLRSHSLYKVSIC